MRVLSYIVLFIIAFMGLTFACLNADPVTINYYIGISKLPLSLLLVIALIFGCVLGLSVSLKMYFRLKKETIHLHSRVKLAEKEVSNLRAIPMKDAH